MKLFANPLLTLCLVPLFCCQFASAQSFDCSKATTAVERAICKSDDLKTLDAGMGEAYKALLMASSGHDKSSLIDAQKAWIEKRDQQCTAAGAEPLEKCLTQTIGKRADELTQQLRKQLGLSLMAFAWIQGYSYSLSNVPGYALDIKDRFSDCPALSRNPSSKVASLVPPGYETVYGIASHRCNAALRVFLRCPKPDEAESCSEMLVLEDPTPAPARLLGELQEEHRTGNSGGIFVPIAFTRDDTHIVLKAWMGSPGAGGGLVNYGYEIMPRDQGTSNHTALAPVGAVFYDEFGKAVYTEDSKKLPTYTQPGPRSNDGLIVVKNLSTLKVSSVLEEPDTTFEILKADEKNHKLIIRATKHAFSASCPRDAEDSLFCSNKTVHERQIPLP